MAEQVQTRCCIVGGGPAGMVFGYLLARSGIDVLVLEKHVDFLRDFRGDTVHPSTLEVLHELGILDSFLARPHQQVQSIGAQIGPFWVNIADLTHLPTKCKFVVLMPQWEFLNFLVESARKFPQFRVMMETEGTDLLEEQGRICGVRARARNNPIEIRADLVVAADGRHSLMRQKANLKSEVLGAPIDVLWMRVSRKPQTDPEQSLGRVLMRKFLVMLNREDYWQCAYVIPKDGFDKIRANGIDSFQRDIAEVAPFLSDRVHELKSWDDIKLLSVRVDRLRDWCRAGFLCIGDSAHAMSPIGGIGINLAIQDAVAAANILAPTLRTSGVSTELLRKVQARRLFPTRATQRLQVLAQDRIVYPALSSDRPIKALPWPLKLLNRFPILRRIPARVIGLGFRPEHVKIQASQ